MKNKLLVGGILTSMLFTNLPVVNAMGNATVEFTGNNNISVGETFTVYMNVTNIRDTYDGVVSLGGNLSFDETKLEYVSSKGVETPYLFQINEAYNYKIAGLDFTLDKGIRETLTVYEFTFKALEEGNATITLTDAKLTDSQSYIDTIVLGKEITIEAKEEIVEEIPVVEEKKETIKQEESKNNETIKIEEVTENIDDETEITEESKENINVEEETTEDKIIEEEIETEINKTNVEKESFVEKIQKVFSDLVVALKKLFK